MSITRSCVVISGINLPYGAERLGHMYIPRHRTLSSTGFKMDVAGKMGNTKRYIIFYRDKLDSLLHAYYEDAACVVVVF